MTRVNKIKIIQKKSKQCSQAKSQHSEPHSQAFTTSTCGGLGHHRQREGEDPG